MQATVESIQTGRPRDFMGEGDSSKPWSSAILKQAVLTPVFVRFHGMEGDEPADRIHHGGPDKAVLAYAWTHYPYWNERHPSCRFTAGAFGENLTVSGLDETTCCLGDILEIGSCLFEVSQPRQPCWKLSRRWGLPKLAHEVQDERRTGWYLRVLREGWVEAGDAIRLKFRPNANATVAWALNVMYAQPRSPGEEARLATLPQLSESWRKTLKSRADHQSASDSKRLLGE